MTTDRVNPERRRAARIKIEADGQVVSDGKSGPATVCDISETGAAIDTDLDPKADDKVEFRTGDGELLMGRVVRSLDGGFAFTFGAGPEGGDAADETLATFKKLTGLG